MHVIQYIEIIEIRFYEIVEVVRSVIYFDVLSGRVFVIMSVVSRENSEAHLVVRDWCGEDAGCWLSRV